MKNTFNLDIAEFYDENEDTLTDHSASQAKLYDEEYSILVMEAKRFFAQCKSTISRTLALHSSNFGFNLPFILNSMIGIQNKVFSNTIRQNLQQQKKQNQNYELSFYDLLHRMSLLVQDLFKLEISIKNKYFSKPTLAKPIQLDHFCISDAQDSDVDSSISSHKISKNIKNSIISHEQIENQQIQQKIRKILREKQTPANLDFQVACTKKISPNQNLQRLTSKLQTLKDKMKNQNTNEEKAWKFFNENRIHHQGNGKTKIKNRQQFILNE